MSREPIGPIVLEKGEERTLQFQLETTDDLAGYSAKLLVKEKRGDASHKLDISGPLTGKVISITFTATHTAEAFAGIYSLVLYDPSSNPTVLSAPGGEPITIKEGAL